MEAKELRIGNWIWDDENKPVKVEYITSERYVDWEADARVAVKFSFSKDDRIWESEFINPIPLTPEILEKARFKRVADKDGIYRTADEQYQIAFFEGRNAVFYIKYDEFRGYCYLNGLLFYLHQLQNLYFSLTGEELEINL